VPVIIYPKGQTCAPLGVEINEKDSLSYLTPAGSDIYCRGSLSNTTLMIYDCDNLPHISSLTNLCRLAIS
jgi:hypothetical protein